MKIILTSINHYLLLESDEKWKLRIIVWQVSALRKDYMQNCSYLDSLLLFPQLLFLPTTMSKKYKPKPKDMMKFFFSPCENKDYYHTCKKCKSKFKQKQNTGFSNLKNHLISCVGKNFQENYEETAVSNIALGKTRKLWVYQP